MYMDFLVSVISKAWLTPSVFFSVKMGQSNMFLDGEFLSGLMLAELISVTEERMGTK